MDLKYGNMIERVDLGENGCHMLVMSGRSTEPQSQQLESLTSSVDTVKPTLESTKVMLTQMSTQTISPIKNKYDKDKSCKGIKAIPTLLVDKLFMLAGYFSNRPATAPEKKTIDGSKTVADPSL